MNTTPAPADLQRWSEELARNPTSLAFLPLARAYRRQGQLEQAMRLCTRGLEQHPLHVEAHALLALLYLEMGDRAKAADEWSTVLRLKPGNFEALRGMGFRHLEQGDIATAKQHLERAALIRPTDTAVQEALRLLRSRPEPAAKGAGQGNGAASAALATSQTLAPAPPAPLADTDDDEPQMFELVEEAVADAVPPAAVHTPAPPAAAPPVAAAAATAEPAGDPTRLFDPLIAGGQILGVLLLDGRGLVLAGRLTGDAAGRAEEVGAVMGGTVDEVARAVAHLELKAWRGMLLECADALLHIAPVGDDALLVLAARRDSPRGWVLRTAQRAVALAAPYLRSYV